MALALYRKYRPRTFAEVIGQEHVTEPLSQALRSGRLNHAYLFSGPRGCGKTSSARILARSLNCEQGPTPEPCGVCASCKSLANDGAGSIDVIEIDAASHGGVDDARDLREKAFFAPASSRYKIYVIDEAHMVSSAGFNALLKLVEEPPEYVKFIFATTEPDKVLGTIRSRTHHYPFRLIPPATLRPYLQQLTEAEGIHVDPAVFPLVVRAGGGSARDTLSVLDQLIAGAGPEGVSYSRAVALLGVTDVTLLDEMCDALAAGDGAAAYQTIDRVAEAGHDPRRFASDLLERFRDLIVLQQVPDAVTKGLIDGPADQLEQMGAQATRLGPATLSRCADIVHNGLVEMRGTTAPRLLLELVTARMLLPGAEDSTGALLQRLERMERRLTLGGDSAEGFGEIAAAGSAPSGQSIAGVSGPLGGGAPAAGLPAAAPVGASGSGASGGAGGGISAARAAAKAAASRRPGAAAGSAAAGAAAAAVAPASAAPSAPVPASAAFNTAAATSAPVSAAPSAPAPVSAAPSATAPVSAAPSAAAPVSAAPDYDGLDDVDPPEEDGPPWDDDDPAFAAPVSSAAPVSAPSVSVAAAPTSGPAGPVSPVSAPAGSAAPVSAGPVAPASGGSVAPAGGAPAGIMPDAPEAGGESAAPAAAVPGQLTAASIREVWPEIISTVGRKSKKIAALAQGATVRELEGQTVVLTFRFPAHARMVAADPSLISDALYEALGGRWQIRCDVAGEGGSGGGGGSAPRRPQGPPPGGPQGSTPAGPSNEAARDLPAATAPDRNAAPRARAADNAPARNRETVAQSAPGRGSEPIGQPGPPPGAARSRETVPQPTPARGREGAPPAAPARATAGGATAGAGPSDDDDGGWPEPVRPGGLAPAPSAIAEPEAEEDDAWPEPVRPGSQASSSPMVAQSSSPTVDLSPAASHVARSGPAPVSPAPVAAAPGHTEAPVTAALTPTPASAPRSPAPAPAPAPPSPAPDQLSPARDPRNFPAPPPAEARSGPSAKPAGAGAAGSGIAAARAAAARGTGAATAHASGPAMSSGAATTTNAPAAATTAPDRAAAPGKAAAAVAAARAQSAGRAAAAGGGAGATGTWSDGSPTEEAPYDPEYDGPAKGDGAYEGFDPGDEPLDDVIDEKTARKSSEAQAVQLLRDAFGAELISES
ncbi:DNA polymerase III subunit gamma and tau [Symbioplanes lichenis]|uniref:DNA polymerase III subunit gamma and tau n=1 Tax=Symbioplanes lichenis TaxID=1629072 RepID=UPI0027398491|nr:DNA polymerase III subunit gamma and tau [Actinoplanes lichenis]